MAWLEMSRDPIHGGEGWGFTQCLWSPTYKKSEANPSAHLRWPYWDLLLQVQPGDVVFHLKGKDKKAAFTGYSIAQTSASVTQDRPPEPGDWNYARSFYRVHLGDYEQFPHPLLLTDVFAKRDQELRQYLRENKGKRKLFYVEQRRQVAGSTEPKKLLQCLNGAYFSEVDAELAFILLGLDTANLEQSLATVVESSPLSHDTPLQSRHFPASVPTGQRMRMLLTRVGQQQFSAAVRDNFGHRCCFPGCLVSADDLFLVGAHIARWSDKPELRGQVDNGLCLCRMHDAAFESGLFTITSTYRVLVKKERVKENPWSREYLLAQDGQAISLGKRKPSLESLRDHWYRTGFKELLPE